MPSNNQKPQSKNPGEKPQIAHMENRDDVNVVKVIPDWEKKSRDDVPASEKPLLTNPFATLEPHKAKKNLDQGDNGGQN